MNRRGLLYLVVAAFCAAAALTFGNLAGAQQPGADSVKAALNGFHAALGTVVGCECRAAYGACRSKSYQRAKSSFAADPAEYHLLQGGEELGHVATLRASVSGVTPLAFAVCGASLPSNLSTGDIDCARCHRDATRLCLPGGGENARHLPHKSPW
jgi:hypothetical protein